jgi:HD-GYP domain-containing protein (c-di-GMP phosphodiesterase class II)
MRNFYSLITIELTTLVVVFCVALVSFATFLFAREDTRLTAPELLETLQTVNAMVGTVREVGGNEARPDPALRSYARRLATPPVLRALDARDRAFLEEPANAVEQLGTEATIARLASIATSVSRTFFEEESQRERIIRLHVIVIAVIGIALLFSGLRIRARYRRFIEHAESLLRSVTAVIEYQDDQVRVPSVWEEERRLAEAAAELARTVRADREMSGDWLYGNLEGLMPRLKEAVEASMPCDRIAVAFVEDGERVVAESAAVSLDEVHLEPGFTEPLAKTSLQHVARSQRPRIINDLQAHYRDVNQSEGTRLVLLEGIQSSLTVPLVVRDHCLGFLFVSSRERGAYDVYDAARAEKLVSLLKQNVIFHYLMQQTVAATANAFVDLMERKDNETSAHITRMSRYSYAIARTLAGTHPELVGHRLVREILWFAPLHDIGKIGIPDRILLKPGPLTSEERAIIEEHVEIGAHVIERMDVELTRILDFSLLPTAMEIIRGHHEWYDGSGYPAGLAGKSIPIAGRITAIADVFDALTTSRPYKEAMPIERALEIIAEGVGTQFDPVVHAALIASLDEIRSIHSTHRDEA